MSEYDKLLCPFRVKTITDGNTTTQEFENCVGHSCPLYDTFEVHSMAGEVTHGMCLRAEALKPEDKRHSPVEIW